MGARPAHRRKRRSTSRTLIEWLAIVVVALVAAVLIRTYLIEAYSIPSGSMEPTIVPGDRLLVNKLAFDFGGVSRGNIVVFDKPPTDTEVGGANHLIKRVIGLPGQSLRSGPDGEIFVDGKLISQPWLTPSARANPGPAICSPQLSTTDCRDGTLYLPKGEYFVMGDNRSDSEDSRYFGPIPRSSIVGEAFLRIWPLGHIRWF